VTLEGRVEATHRTTAFAHEMAESGAPATPSNLPAQVAVVGCAFTWLVLVATFVVPRHVVGHPPVAASGTALTGLSIAPTAGGEEREPSARASVLTRAPSRIR
jgi:hypothetical protein